MQSSKNPLSLLKTGFHSLLPTCRDVARLQSESLDHSLSFPKRLGMRVHLLVCSWCRRYGKQIHFLQQAVREHPDELTQSHPHVLSPEARERLKRALREQAD
jgi:hypothetical protein